MTPADFIVESLSFLPGEIVVVSGEDINAVRALLNDCRTSIEAVTPNIAMVMDSRQTILYDQRASSTASIYTDVEHAQLWEYMALLADNSFVVLVANEFDPSNKDHNPSPTVPVVDVVRDLMGNRRVLDIPYAYNSKYGAGTRELFQFIRRIYWYDIPMTDVQQVKIQEPDRP
jgi:hypothetical protein